jgi:5-oxoprolinase (ATP-hydrolysing)
MSRVLLHPLAGVLSAYGIGLARLGAIREHAVEAELTGALVAELARRFDTLAREAAADVARQGGEPARIETLRSVHLRYRGTDQGLAVAFAPADAMRRAFDQLHHRQFGFAEACRPLVVEAIAVEAIAAGDGDEAAGIPAVAAGAWAAPIDRVRAWFEDDWEPVDVFARERLVAGQQVTGPAIITEAHTTTVIEPGWCAEMRAAGELILSRAQAPRRVTVGPGRADPVMLEVFNNLFMSIAEQMGAVLAKTAHSVNIKERLDFSCAVFDAAGGLVANAPHLPVHLGSMGESVEAVIRARAGSIKPGDAYALNAPYNGGTHLPDVTVVSPVFDDAGQEILFYVGCRGHHADIGGTTPGSMPPDSRSVDEEGVLIDDLLVVEGGRLREAEIRALLGAGPYPARNPGQNLADLRAQLAANEKGAQELRRMVADFGRDVIAAYMRHVQDNAEEQVRRVIGVLQDGAFACEMDEGQVVRVAIRIDRRARAAVIDFAGTSGQQASNLNAPPAVTRAAVLYVFRTLVDDDIPLNAGCLKPLTILIPPGSMLDPRYPAPVVAGNVETSQVITNALFGALGALAAAQGTMNNFTFGNARHQYYETICGGAGAGPGFAGASAVHTHMTNTRLTDPEILEWRYPVLVQSFAIRRGSGGRGRWPGGDGVVRRILFREAMTAAILSGHRRIAPFGLRGGGAGACGRNAVERGSGRIEPLAGTARVEVAAGDVFVIETPGGGGFGGIEGEGEA